MKLKGKVVLVTGAGRGIGKALALGFAAEGADVIVVSRTRDELEITAEEINKLGRKAWALEADVSQEHDVRRIADEISHRMGRLDVLINNAALRMIHIGKRDSYLVSFSEITIEDWDKMVATNLRGPFLSIKMCLPLLGKAGAASIINISAGGGKRGMAGRVPYCASKFGLEGLTQSLAEEFRSLNIAVNSLSPGRLSILTDAVKRDELKKNPKIKFMKPEIMVPPAIFLALQDSRGTSGQHIEALEWVSQQGLGGVTEWRAT